MNIKIAKRGVLPTAREIWITTSFIGFHWWKEASDDREYLGLVHRHKFNVKVVVPVSHSNRHIEFHALKHEVDVTILGLDMFTLDTAQSLSCEQIAEYLGNQLRSTSDIPVDRIEIDEDGENGCIIYFE